MTENPPMSYERYRELDRLEWELTRKLTRVEPMVINENAEED